MERHVCHNLCVFVCDTTDHKIFGGIYILLLLLLCLWAQQLYCVESQHLCWHPMTVSVLRNTIKGYPVYSIFAAFICWQLSEDGELKPTCVMWIGFLQHSRYQRKSSRCLRSRVCVFSLSYYSSPLFILQVLIFLLHLHLFTSVYYFCNNIFNRYRCVVSNGTIITE